MKMHNPPHPGEILRDDVLPDLGLSVTAAAAALGVSRVSLSRVLHGRAAISPDMAVRLGQWLGNGGEVWLRMQASHDLWHAERQRRPRIVPARKAA
ncbi:MAG: HigA family addiction module antidote protein [Cyanobacteria bacterium SZAS LIN-2]|nr:HigA family addiction module antidote protein [Cyanobacteria bacterium SZAS LIN-2]